MYFETSVQEKMLALLLRRIKATHIIVGNYSLFAAELLSTYFSLYDCIVRCCLIDGLSIVVYNNC